ncbi:HD domain-containing protein [Paraburkholderia panacisoli]|uniref:HD domain-containing protein n=1 Tax=Paraburkholderia panacisoli TaxID=2603818 RepID=A0A5B0GNH2_9BURK|nr:HD domain-containing protein [Paraburkholderia panacisoli]KAA1003459.1 HD domain-containing protein [Paraburkholderia panacisoli]
MSTPVTIGGFTAPDSEFTRKAASIVEQVHSKAMMGHVHRTWWFAEYLGKKRGLKYDREVVYLAALFHDLGLSEEYSADNRFEVDGADAASRILLTDNYPEAKAQLVWDGIALHSSGGIADRKQPEIALIYMGAHVDVFGMFMDEITPSFVDDVLQLYPRVGFKLAFQQAIAEVARKKPHTAIGTGLADVARRHIHGFECANLCDFIDHSPFES